MCVTSMMRWAGNVACMGEKRNVSRVVGGGEEREREREHFVDLTL
jgi:hypothetical protein